MRYAVKVFEKGKVFGFKTFGTRTEAEEFKKNIIKRTEHKAIVYEIELVPVEDGE
ncbi:hypothetical protein [Lactococcus lactis]|uniref:Uncharacterized protein n=1 Tax=Lactococcus lactis subsp. lactis TaxID=1360 RepID=A0AAJ4JV63_LACLL|nr:hypothetical protein [Lactococcus lactis]QRZ34764.1 hypothetical protein LL223_1108 [Lactococcus lactis subsp. lactis]